MSREPSTSVPTDRPEALKNFVEGRDQFNAYLGKGGSGELQEASRLFEEAANSDPDFDLAWFYHALTRVELRDSRTAIRELERLVDKGVDFLPEAYLQLAYARTKTYIDEEYYKAEQELERATAEAARASARELEPVIEAYRVFLYAVMGGRLDRADVQRRGDYLDKAIRLGEMNLRRKLRRRERHSVALIKMELHNAVGIAYMWKGWWVAEAFSKQQEKFWRLASNHFQQALALRMNPVRVHQNLGTLLQLQGRQFQVVKGEGHLEEAEDCYRSAIREYEVAITLNPLDQFPYFELARLYARLAQWELAQERFTYGRLQRGEPKSVKWERLERAIAERDASILDEE